MTYTRKRISSTIRFLPNQNTFAITTKLLAPLGLENEVQTILNLKLNLNPGVINV
jgi:hypothetical protein